MYTDKSRNQLISAGLLVIALMVVSAPARAQSPAPSPTSASTADTDDYKITSSFEFGYRFRRVNGDLQKYRSDLNYGAGVRLFDSTFLIEGNGKSHSLIDNALVTTSGWGADPSGSATVKMNKTGAYKIDASLRKVVYFNNLKNFATNWSQPITTGSEHQFNTKHYFGDFDLTLLPENEIEFRFSFG